MDHPQHLNGGATRGEEEHADHEASWLSWLRVGFVAVLIVLVRWGAAPRFHRVDLLALAGILIGGFPILKAAIADLWKAPARGKDPRLARLRRNHQSVRRS